MNSQQPLQQLALQQLRQQIRQQRRQIPQTIQQQHSELIIQHIIEADFYKNSQNIALYLATDGEVDISSIIEQLLNDSKSIFLPVISSSTKGIMHFAGYTEETILEKNCFDILEPAYQAVDLIPAEQLDLVLAPLVSFDEQGNRMGMGGGYYDRALQHLNKDNKKTQLIGIAHELQKTEQLESNEWDIPLDGVITEKRLSYF